MEGTLIETVRGQVPIERLEIGDLVMTGSGDARPVRWLGRDDVDCERQAKPIDAYPVRILAGAFGEGRPSSDLYLSRGHSVCVDLCGEILVPIGCLINGATVASVKMPRVTYWHIELDNHDLVRANGLLAETYLEMDNRQRFAISQGEWDLLTPIGTRADFCRPFVNEGRLVEFIRDRLAGNARDLGWRHVTDTGMRLTVDGEERLPLMAGGCAVFVLPAKSETVALRSSTFRPSDTGQGDARLLGLSIHGISFTGSRGGHVRVALDDVRLADSFHEAEARSGVCWRWTKKDLALSPELWRELEGDIVLTVVHDATVHRGWIRPGPGRHSVTLPAEQGC